MRLPAPRLAALALALLALTARANPNVVLATEGQLLDAADHPVEGVHDVVFAIHARASEAPGQLFEPVWTATYTVTFSRGLYAVSLGDLTDAAAGGTPLPGSLFDGTRALFLGFRIDGGQELRPRLSLRPLPAASLAYDAQRLGGHEPSFFLDAANLTGQLPAEALPLATATAPGAVAAADRRFLDGLSSTAAACTAPGKILRLDAAGWTCADLSDATVKAFARSALPGCTAEEALTAAGGVLSCVSVRDGSIQTFARQPLPTCLPSQVLGVDAGALGCVTPPAPTAETDPKVGAVASGRVCTGTGSGVACDAPAPAVDGIGNVAIAGQVRVGGSSVTCDAQNAGALRYVAADGRLEFCNGALWAGLRAQDVSPDAFSFTNLSGQNVSAVVSAGPVTPTGYEGPLGVSVTGTGSPQIQIAGGAWVTNGQLNPGQTLSVRVTTPAIASSSVAAVVALGSYSTTWAVSTGTTTPAAFSFTDQTGVALSTAITSNAVTLTGFVGTLAVTPSAGVTVSVNSGAFASSATMVSGDSIRLRITSSSSGGGAVTGTVTVGTTTSATWRVTTLSEQVWQLNEAWYSVAPNTACGGCANNSAVVGSCTVGQQVYTSVGIRNCSYFSNSTYPGSWYTAGHVWSPECNTSIGAVYCHAPVRAPCGGDRGESQRTCP